MKSVFLAIFILEIIEMCALLCSANDSDNESEFADVEL